MLKVFGIGIKVMEVVEKWNKQQSFNKTPSIKEVDALPPLLYNFVLDFIVR